MLPPVLQVLEQRTTTAHRITQRMWLLLQAAVATEVNQTEHQIIVLFKDQYRLHLPPSLGSIRQPPNHRQS